MGNLWLRYDGKYIYYMDFGDCERAGDALECLLQGYYSISGSDGRLLVLYHFDSPAVLSRDFGSPFHEIHKLACFVGKIKKLALFCDQGANAPWMQEKGIRRFDTRFQALDWLVSD